MKRNRGEKEEMNYQKETKSDKVFALALLTPYFMAPVERMDINDCITSYIHFFQLLNYWKSCSKCHF